MMHHKGMNLHALCALVLTALLLVLAPAALAKTITVDAADYLVEEVGWYDTMEEVAVYLTFFEELPDNYLTKKEAQKLGWESRKGNLWDVADGCSIGGDSFGNREGLLPTAKGRKWTECDIDFDGGFRGGERIVFSNDGLIYYTGDHYESFDEIEVIWSDDGGVDETGDTHDSYSASGDDGYAYKDDSYADDDFGSLFSDEELDSIMNWLFGE